jgi:dolichyl-phosphate-mannose-protein mannosyltransferase
LVANVQLFSAYTQVHGPQPIDMRIVTFFTIIGILVRIYMLENPGEVVFDEVHFGGFASKYIKGTFFFDVHPPVFITLI